MPVSHRSNRTNCATLYPRVHVPLYSLTALPVYRSMVTNVQPLYGYTHSKHYPCTHARPNQVVRDISSDIPRVSPNLSSLVFSFGYSASSTVTPVRIDIIHLVSFPCNFKSDPQTLTCHSVIIPRYRSFLPASVYAVSKCKLSPCCCYRCADSPNSQ